MLLEENVCYETVRFLGKTLLAFAMLHFVLQGQTYPLLQVSLFFFFKLYIIVLILPNIKMNLPQVYICSSQHFDFLHFFSSVMILVSTSCTMLLTSFHSFSGTLLDLIPLIYLSLPLFNCKGFDLGHT